MRVKIAYTVELEEVENEVKEILGKGITDIDEALSDSMHVLSELDSSQELPYLVQTLDSSRRKLARADAILNDCQSILDAYSQVLKKLEEEQNENQD